MCIAGSPPHAKEGELVEATREGGAVPVGLVGSWTLIAIDGHPGEVGDLTPTLEIREDGSIGGFSGVNRFMTALGSDALVQGNISLDQAATTRMAGPPRAMAFEKIYLERLAAVTGFEVDGDTLRLRAGDAEVLTFNRVDEE